MISQPQSAVILSGAKSVGEGGDFAQSKNPVEAGKTSPVDPRDCARLRSRAVSQSLGSSTPRRAAFARRRFAQNDSEDGRQPKPITP